MQKKALEKAKKSVVPVLLTLLLLSLPVFACNSSNHRTVSQRFRHREPTEEQSQQWEDDLNKLHKEVNKLDKNTSLKIKIR